MTLPAGWYEFTWGIGRPSNDEEVDLFYPSDAGYEGGGMVDIALSDEKVVSVPFDALAQFVDNVRARRKES